HLGDMDRSERDVRHGDGPLHPLVLRVRGYPSRHRWAHLCRFTRPCMASLALSQFDLRTSTGLTLAARRAGTLAAAAAANATTAMAATITMGSCGLTRPNSCPNNCMSHQDPIVPS